MSNTNRLNIITPDFRDVLLNKNLVPNDDVLLLANNIGMPVEINPGLSVVDVPGIAEISDEFRDGLIVRNPYQNDDENRDAMATTTNNGTVGNDGHIGTPYDELDHSNNDFIQDSDQRVTTQTLRNQYLISDDQKERINIVEEMIPRTPQKNGYIDAGGNLNLGGGSVAAGIDVIGGFLGGDLAIGGDGGLHDGYDVRATLAGRVLGATGVIEETPLGVEAGKGLARAFANNAAAGLQQETTGRINTNPLDLLTGGELFVPNYDITVPKGKVGKVLNFLSRVAGVESPVSLLEDSSWQYTPTLCGVGVNNILNGTIERNNELIKNTGKGQINQLFFTLKQNCYAPAYDDSRLSKGEGLDNPQQYPLNSREYPNTLSSTEYNDSATNYARTCDDGNIIDVKEHQWDTTLYDNKEEIQYKDVIVPETGGQIHSTPVLDAEGNIVSVTTATAKNDINPYVGFEKSLLYKTKELFSNGEVKTLITRDSIEHPSNTVSNYYDGLKMSKGSGITSKNCHTKDTELCRVWSTMRRYNQVQKLQKHKGLNNEASETSVHRMGTEHSVLGKNGFVKISPYSNQPENAKRFMFSLENLAWADHSSYLEKNYPGELGPGDLLTGKKGRIMWFPPYGINFSDNTTTSLETTNFIGRGEPVYTYNYTERIGTLEFMLVVDHPSLLNTNEFRGGDNAFETERKITAMFAGCEDPNLNGENTDVNEDEEIITNKPQEKISNDSQTLGPWFFYFPNDCDEIPENYEYPNKEEAITTTTPCYGIKNNKELSSKKHTNKTYFGLNENIVYDFEDINDILVNDIGEGSNDITEYTVKITGFASKGQQSGTPSDYNLKLSKSRADKVFEYITDGWGLVDGFPELTMVNTIIEAKGENGTHDTKSFSTKGMKEARYVSVEIEYSSEKKETIQVGTPTTQSVITGTAETTTHNLKYSEVDYFKALKETDKITYDQISQQLKYFTPAYHSTTPEGFNSRLNFLQQCLRQGPTDKDDIKNLSFGRAPVCILRLGDFYHTKIMIDTLNISPAEGVQWDLNPEGIGVQPMILNVSLTFKIIGGSSMQGPINKLQNAISFNYYANTGVYDKRADKIKVDSDGKGTIDPGDRIMNNQEMSDREQIESMIPKGIPNSVGSTISEPDDNQLLDAANQNKKEEEPKEEFNESLSVWVDTQSGDISVRITNPDPNVFFPNGTIRCGIFSNPEAGGMTVATANLPNDGNMSEAVGDYDKRPTAPQMSESTLSGGYVQIVIGGVVNKKIDLTDNNVV